MEKGSFKIKVGLAEMLKGGVIMDVTNVEQACIAEKAGAVAVMALEKIPADIRKDGGISRMSNPEMITKIQDKVSTGELDQGKLVEEAQTMMGSLTGDNPLFNNLMKQQNQQPPNNSYDNPTRERLKKKLEKRNNKK